MPTQTYTLPNASIVFSGQWNDTTAGGHNARQLLGNNTQIDFVVTGTALTLLANYPSSVTVTASIDGGAFANLASNGGTWAAVSVFTGLADTAHTVTIKQTAGSPSNFYLDRDATFTLTGSVPTLAAPTGFGSQFPLNDATFHANSSQEGSWVSTNIAGYASPTLLTTLWPDVVCRFQAQCASVKVWMFQDGTKLQTRFDGADAALVTTANTGQYGWVTLFTGLDTTATHEYGFSIAYTPGTSYVYALMLVGGTGLVTAAYPTLTGLACYGDSITLGFAGTGNDSALAYPHRLGLQEAFAVANRGLGGSTVIASGQTRTSDITGLNPAPANIIVCYGTNDLAQVSGAETVAQFQTAYTSMMNALVVGVSSAKLYCMGILPRKDFNATQRAPWSTAIQTVVSNLANPNVTFVGVEGWIDDSSGSPDLFDSVHPNAAGYAKIVTRLAAYFNSTSNVKGTVSMAYPIPRKDAQYSATLGNFITVASANLTTLGFTSADITALTATKTDLDAKMAAATAAHASAKSATTAKRTSYAASTTAFRTAIKKVEANPAVPPALLNALGFQTSGTKPSRVIPQVPTHLSAMGSPTGVNTLQWKANGNTQGVRYQVEASYGDAGTWNVVGYTSRIKFEHPHQTPGAKVYYRVKAVRTDLNSAYSNNALAYGLLSSTSEEPVLQLKAA